MYFPPTCSLCQSEALRCLNGRVIPSNPKVSTDTWSWDSPKITFIFVGKCLKQNRIAFAEAKIKPHNKSEWEHIWVKPKKKKETITSWDCYIAACELLNSMCFLKKKLRYIILQSVWHLILGQDLFLEILRTWLSPELVMNLFLESFLIQFVIPIN